MGEVTRSMQRIYAVVDNLQADHQEYIIEMEGKLQEKMISILIDTSSNYSYVSPELLVKCGLGKYLHKEPWLVQLETGTKRRINH